MLTISGIELRDTYFLKKYAYFCLSKFISNGVLKKSIINVKFVTKDDLIDKEDRKDLRSMSAWMTYDGIINERKKFTIIMSKSAINKNGKQQITRYKNVMKYLAHELIHVKQYLLNELFAYADGKTSRYMGGKYKESGELDWSYWDTPFEIEAYGRMEGLYQMFLQKLKED